MNKTQIDRLGIRLKKGQATPEDLRMLDEFRRSFSPPYENIILAIERELNLKPTGRPGKSTTSISEKLVRESIRLTQIQDIAGCRLVVVNVTEQDRVVAELVRIFPNGRIIDRRTSPSNGYRAVHVILDSQGKLVEVQVRTSLQHLWAEVSEKFSDVVDPAIKYGRGDERVRRLLARMSNLVATIESIEQHLESPSVREEIRSLLEDAIKDLASVKGGADAISD